jgi:hypothetical protein
VRQASRYEYARAIARRYGQAGKLEKGRILDEFTAATGYQRKYAIGLLNHPPVGGSGRAQRARPRRYGAAEADLLRACWELADGICGKRLAPFLGELLSGLAASAALPTQATPELVARVAGMSASTVDRLLAAARPAWPRRGLGTTKPGTLLKQQVPIRTFASWDEARPGFLEMDLVAHCGTSGAGEFLFTLSAVDVTTGWMSLQAVRNKGELAVFAALEQLRADLPFPLLGLDCDNGGELINHNLLRYCQAERITLTRSRPYRKNDTCHIEQKNWSVVRRLVGYARFERAALPALNRVYTVARDYVNFYQPVRKLTAKVRDGARVTRRYDRAQTPYRRLLAGGQLTPTTTAALADRATALHLVRLKLDLEAAQQALYRQADRPARIPPARPGRLDSYVRHR